MLIKVHKRDPGLGMLEFSGSKVVAFINPYRVVSILQEQGEPTCIRLSGSEFVFSFDDVTASEMAEIVLNAQMEINQETKKRKVKCPTVSTK